MEPRHINKMNVLPAVEGHAGMDFITDHLRHANLLSQANEETQETSDQEFNSNETFWKSVLSEETRALKWITLTNFQVVDWYPRSPGLYHSKSALRTRNGAERYVREENGVVFYVPHGKVLMIQGGVGTVRFKSFKIEGEDCWLCTATSDGYCESGVPLAIPNRIMEKVGFDSRTQFKIRGQIRFLPDFLEPHFNHLAKIPQLYVFVDKLEKISVTEHSVYISPVVFFTSEAHSKEPLYNGSVSYVRCESDNQSAISGAIDWLEWYAQKYRGEIITNFDQQRPSFENAPFSLQNIMSGQISKVSSYRLGLNWNSEELTKAIEKAKTIALTLYAGEIKMHDINMSGDFRNSILNINSTLSNTKQTITSNASLDQTTKEDLQRLIDQLAEALQKAPAEKAEEAEAVAKSAKLLVETATEEKPNKTMVSISGESLKKAAQNVADVLPDVLKIAMQILIFFNLPH